MRLLLLPPTCTVYIGICYLCYQELFFHLVFSWMEYFFEECAKKDKLRNLRTCVARNIIPSLPTSLQSHLTCVFAHSGLTIFASPGELQITSLNCLVQAISQQMRPHPQPAGRPFIQLNDCHLSACINGCL